MDTDNDRPGMQRHYIFGLLAALVTAIIFFIWVAVPVINSQFVYGYPRIASIPGPNTFVNTRSTAYTVAIALLAINGLLPFLLMTAIQENKVGEWGAMHTFISAAAVFINVGVFLFLAFTWFAMCNNGLGVANTSCQDPRYCCANYAINLRARDLCPNNGICTPDVASTELSISGAYLAHFWFSLIFIFTSWGHIAVNKRLVVYGVLQV